MPNVSKPRAIANWLYVVAAMVFAMVVIGGITRLTESGLSITEWKPITGVVPPLSQAAWQVEFDHYRQIDQYAAIHSGMTLAQFKGIFFWEYLHRLLGRLIGTVFFVPLIWFWVRKQIPQGYLPRLIALLMLGGLQGAFGWWMVKSGLKPGQVEVAHGWLAVHLLTALFTMAGLIWTALDLRDLARHPNARAARLTGAGAVAGLLLFVQLMFGAFTAGLRAGLVTDQWPLMNGKIFPGASVSGRGMIDAIFNDPAIVHFIHRWWAWAVLAGMIVLARKAKAARDRRASIAVHSAVGLQILLGIGTVVMGVPIWMAALHQMVGASLVAATAWAAHSAGRRVA